MAQIAQRTATREISKPAPGSSPFLMEPDPVSITDDFSGPAVDLARLERLCREQPQNVEQAREAVKALQEQISEPGSRALLIRALRDPNIPALTFDQLRAELFRDLHPYVSESEVQSLYVQELEGRNKNIKACEQAVFGFNEMGVIESPEICHRIFKLMAQPVPENDPISKFEAILCRTGCNPELAKLRDLAANNYALRNQMNPIQIRAMVLSGDTYTAETLRWLAEQRVHKPWAWGPVMAWGAASTSAGLLGAFFCAVETVKFSVWGPIIGGIIGAGVVGGFIHSTIRFLSNFDQNPSFAQTLIDGLRYGWSNPTIRSTLTSLAGDAAQSAKIREQAQLSLDAGRTLKIVNCLNGIRHSSKEAERRLRRYVGTGSDRELSAILRKLAQDSAPEIQHAAYKAADKLGIKI